MENYNINKIDLKKKLTIFHLNAVIRRTRATTQRYTFSVFLHYNDDDDDIDKDKVKCISACDQILERC